MRSIFILTFMDLTMENTKKNDFIEIKYTGFANGQIFDSNIDDDLKKINDNAKAKETIIIVGQGMVVPGLDKALEGKEIGKDYEITVSVKEGFGERIRELVKTIPLRIFTEKNIDPRPGMVLALDNALAKIITVSGARVVTDFNNPLAGKELRYKFKIVKMVTDEKDKCNVVFDLLFRFVPKFEIKGKEVIAKGPKQLEIFVNALKDKFKEIIEKDLKFELEEKAEKKEEEKENN